jgi:putative transposase
MARCRRRFNIRTIARVLADVIRFTSSMLRPRAQLAAENLFLRKQLALYLERQVRPRRADDAIRLALVALSRLIEWRPLLIVVKPETLIRWHRKGVGLFWRWKSRPSGRPRVPINLRRLIAEMAAANRTWGEERIASELLMKLGIRVSPRTVRRYMRSGVRTEAWTGFSGVEHVRAKSCALHACLRLLRDRDG